MEELYCELDYHDQKIQRTLTRDIQKYWAAVSTLLDLINSVYRDLHYRLQSRNLTTELSVHIAIHVTSN